MFDQQLTFDGDAEDIASATKQDRLFTAPKSIRGQLPLTEPAKLVRSMSRGKFHVVESFDDHVALRGVEHISVGGFNHRIADGYDQWAIEAGMVCKRCLAKR